MMKSTESHTIIQYEFVLKYLSGDMPTVRRAWSREHAVPLDGRVEGIKEGIIFRGTSLC
jgi:hypothetical protein